MIPESEFIINSDGTAFHLHMKPEFLADNVILVGDQGRVDMIKEFLSDIESEGISREFHHVTGHYNGKRVTVLSTGIGPDNIDITVNELDALANLDFKTREFKPAHRKLTMLRIGTCGAIRPEIPLGGYVLSEMSLGFDGLANWYQGYDSVTEKDIEDAFVKYMNWNERLATPYFVKSSQSLIDKFKGEVFCGITMSAPGFYGPQGRTVHMTPVYPDLIDKLENFSFNGYRITNIEMESSAISALGQMLGHETATICLAVANRHRLESIPDYKPLMNGLIKLALDKLTL